MIRRTLLLLLLAVTTSPLWAATPATPPDPKSPITVIEAWKDHVDQTVPLPPPVIELDNAKQLFVDDWLIETATGVKRTFFAATKHLGNPLLVPEKPWEIPSVLLSGSVIYDPQRTEDRFRMWYLCYTPKHNARFEGVKSKEGCIAYAISADGLHWTRPNLGLNLFQGSCENNIVVMGPYELPGVICDPRDPDPNRRYKAHARTSRGHTAYLSPDGIRWSDPQVMKLDGYDRSSIHWDPVRQIWFASTKSWYRTAPGAEIWRGRGYQASDDFLNFQNQSIFLAGTEPNSCELCYALEPFYYESMYLGVWARYRHEPDGRLDPQLAISRNGLLWERPNDESLIPLTPLPPGFVRRKTAGSPETGVDAFALGVPWDYANSNINILGPLRVNDELWFYYSGRSSDHRTSPQTGSIGLATMRLDGFASMNAEEEGTIVTRPLRLGDGPLRLNADASKGEIRVEILDEDQRPIEPFTAANAQPLTTNHLRHDVKWCGTSDLATLKGRTVRLRLTIRHAHVYSLWVGDELQWATPDSTTWQESAGPMP